MTCPRRHPEPVGRRIQSRIFFHHPLVFRNTLFVLSQPMENKSYTYILFSQRNGTLYVGVTNDLKRRITEHKEKMIPGFTQRYGVDKLGYFEEYNDIRLAIQREKELKGWNRKRKLALLEGFNPQWKDLFFELQ